MSTDYREMARRLRNAVEPVAAGVYFAPEAHAAYAALGFAGSPAAADGVARPELKSYFTSRGACLGQVSGEVVAAAFGCFNPKVVVPAVAAGWQIAGREAILGARERGATAMLLRVLGDRARRPGSGHRSPAPRRGGGPVAGPHDVRRAAVAGLPRRSGECVVAGGGPGA